MPGSPKLSSVEGQNWNLTRYLLYCVIKAGLLELLGQVSLCLMWSDHEKQLVFRNPTYLP